MKKLAVITGAGSGIGRATAMLFHKNHYDLFLVGRDSGKLEETGRLCSQGKGQVHWHSCDVGQESQVQELAGKISEQSPEGIALINNAGIFRGHPVGDGGAEIWLSQFQVNLFGAVFVVQNLLPLMRSGYSHSITNVSSTLGLKPTADTSAYSASKAAMVNWTQSLALGLGSRKIRANCVCPGFVDTPIHGFHHETGDKKIQTLEKLGPLQPLGRIGTSEEVAQSIFFLASEQSSWTTGAVLSVDGGINIT